MRVMETLTAFVAVSALWLAGCDTTESDDDPTNSTLEISGVIVNYDGSTAREIRATPRQTPDEVLASSPVASDGSFDLGAIPAPPATYLENENPNDVSSACVAAVVLSDTTVRSTGLTLRLFEGAAQVGYAYAATHDPEQTPTPTDYNVGFEYYDKPLEATGYVECDYSNLPEDTNVVRTNYNLQLGAGWNKITRRYLSLGPDGSMTMERITLTPEPSAREFYWVSTSAP